MPKLTKAQKEVIVRMRSEGREVYRIHRTIFICRRQGHPMGDQRITPVATTLLKFGIIGLKENSTSIYHLTDLGRSVEVD